MTVGFAARQERLLLAVCDWLCQCFLKHGISLAKALAEPVAHDSERRLVGRNGRLRLPVAHDWCKALATPVARGRSREGRYDSAAGAAAGAASVDFLPRFRLA